MDGDPQQARGEGGDLRRARDAVFELDTLAQAPDCGRRGDATHLGQVLLVDAVTWMGDSLRQLAVVREQDQSLGRDIEPADSKDTWLARDELHDCGSPARVRGRRHDARRLVEEVVDEARQDADWDAVYLHMVGLDVDAAPELGECAVHRHAPVGDELLAQAPAAEADTGENLLEPFAFGLLPARRRGRHLASGRSACSSISTVEAGGTNSTRRGRSPRESRPSLSRKSRVVPNRTG